MSHTVDGQTTTYTWDVAASLPIVLQDNTYTYVYGLDLISATDAGGNQNYYMHNGQGSVANIVDYSGAEKARYLYDAFGNTRYTLELTPNVWRYAGEQQDDGTGFYYLRARYYDPFLGRFLSQDPVPGGNLYVYTDNNPVNRTDPSGLCFGLGDCGPIDDVDNVLEDAYQAGDDALAVASEVAQFVAPYAIECGIWGGSAFIATGNLAVAGVGCATGVIARAVEDAGISNPYVECAIWGAGAFVGAGFVARAARQAFVGAASKSAAGGGCLAGAASWWLDELGLSTPESQCAAWSIPVAVLTRGTARQRALGGLGGCVGGYLDAVIDPKE